MQNYKRIIPIVFSVDDNYAPFLGVALKSILDNAKSNNYYKIYVLNTEISQNNIEKLNEYNCDIMEIKFVDVAERMSRISKDKIHLRDYYTKAIYYRIFIPNLFPQYEKILYLDCDVVLLADVANLYDVDLGDNIFAAIHEETMTVMDVFGKYSELFLGVQREKYFNSGVLLINSSEYRKAKIEEKFISIMHKYKFEVAPDQDYLNVLCKDRIKYCDIGWNKTPFPEEINPFDDSKLKLVHFKLNFKPWHYDGVRYEKFFWNYANATPFYNQLLEIKLTFTKAQEEKEKREFIALQVTAEKYTLDEENYKTFVIE